MKIENEEFERALDHVIRFIDLRIDLIDMVHIINATEAISDSLPFGLVLIDNSKRPFYVNNALKDDINKPINITPDGISFSGDSDQKRYRLWQSACASNADLRQPNVSWSSEDRTDYLFCLCHITDDIAFDFDPLFSSILFVFNKKYSLANNANLLSSEFGITRIEGEVLVGVLNGLSGVEIQRELGLSTDAVKKRLQSIYKKTKTNKKTQLIAMFSYTLELSLS